MILGTALDDLPEALSMGIGFASGQGRLGVVLALSIFLHNIPEGISSTSDLIDNGSLSARSHGPSFYDCNYESFRCFDRLLHTEKFKRNVDRNDYGFFRWFSIVYDWNKPHTKST